MALKAHSRTTLAAGMMALALTAGACTPILLTGGGGGDSTPCHVGTWELTGQQIAHSLMTTFGELSVTADNDGMTLVLGSDGSFSFSGAQTLGVSGSTPWGTVEGVAATDVTVGGSYTAETDDTLEFRLESISGSVSFDGTFDGDSLSVSMALSELGLEDIYGLEGKASISCSTNQLSLDFFDIDKVDWDF